jgi:hypothetical protein
MPMFIPEITKAYQDDPRTKLAQHLVAMGGNTAPVAGGKWAWADGIARAMAGAAGGYAQKKQQDKYEAREQGMADKVAAALAGTPETQGIGVGGAAANSGGGGALPPQGVQQAQQPTPAPVPPPEQNNPQPQNDPLALPPPPPGFPGTPMEMASQAAPSAPQGPSPAAQAVPASAPAPAPAAPQIAAALGGGGAANPAAPFIQSAGVERPAYNRTVQAQAPTRTTKPSTAGIDARSVASELGYGDHITSGYRGPNHRLSKANPRSYHAKTHAAIDVKPIPGMTYGEYIKSYEDAGYTIVEAKNEVGKGRTKHATGDHWHVVLGKGGEQQAPQGSAGPAPSEMQPSGPVQYQTAEPGATALPDRPADRGSAQSYRMSAGNRLLAMRDPALFERSMKMLDEGMGEQFTADRDALSNNNAMDRDLYSAGINDHYSAQQQARGAAYEARGDERREHFAYGRETRGYTHANNDREDSQAFTGGENLAQRNWQAGQNSLDRSATAANVQAQIQGRKETEQEKRATRLQNWLQTPQGSKAYAKTTEEMTKFDGIVQNIDAFMDLNAKENTGGMLMNMPTGAGEWFARNLNTNTQQMNQITEAIAPLLRQAGSGAMSDKDLAGFKQSVPNIRVDFKANQGAAQRMKLGVARMNDFEMEKLAAQSEGRGVDFLREWSIFKARVPYTSGKSFAEWKAENTYNAQGGQ